MLATNPRHPITAQQDDDSAPLKLVGDIADALLAEVASIKYRTESLFSPLETDLVALTVLEDLNHSADRMDAQLMKVCAIINALEGRDTKAGPLEVAS